jgi:hypothetical protein
MWVTENSFIHIEGSEKSVNNIDQAAESMLMAYVLFLRHARPF